MWSKGRKRDPQGLTPALPTSACNQGQSKRHLLGVVSDGYGGGLRAQGHGTQGLVSQLVLNRGMTGLDGQRGSPALH